MIIVIRRNRMKLTEEVEKVVIKYIIDSIEHHENDLVGVVMEHFELSMPTVRRLIKQLIEEDVITQARQRGRYPGYRLKTKSYHSKYDLSEGGLHEDKIYYDSIMPHLEGAPRNVQQLLEYAAMEIINNAIDHSGGKVLQVRTLRNARRVTVQIIDDGIGIFRKIQQDLNLQTPQQSILELCKGKFTSDPAKHSGEGIFFSSRMVDIFIIVSYGLFFSGHENHDVIEELASEEKLEVNGTIVHLVVDLDTDRTPVEVFNKYADQDMDPTFHKTIIPVRIMNIEGGNLVSRSQAKRLLARVDRFKTVVLDFDGVQMIGQAFADEVFRVYRNEHEDVQIESINTNADIQKMIAHVTKKEPGKV
jgi:predicted transcriptional regulator/anti-sigma regulatory factor (Ser/Thr protein kinase)